MRAEEQSRIGPEGPWWKEETVYQIYPRNFRDSNSGGIGDIWGILKKLDYLKALGVTMLWLCPMYQSPMDDNGYDASDYYTLAPELGTMEELGEFIERVGDMGAKITSDLVINHTSDEHQWFKQAMGDPEREEHSYYIFKKGNREPNSWRSVFGGNVWERVGGRNERYFHAFEEKQPDLNWESETLRKKLCEMVNWWLEKGIAGFRINVITFIKKDLTLANQRPDRADGRAKCTKASRNQLGIGEFLNELRREAFDRYECVTVVEAPDVPYEGLGGFIGRSGYFSIMSDFRYADLDIASGSERFKRKEWTVREFKDKIMTSQMTVRTYGWGANFIEDHDQPRATTKYLKEATESPSAVEILTAMYLFLRGAPFLYQEQELGMVSFERSSLDAFNDISSIDRYHRSLEGDFSEEETLRIINLRSRDNARTPLPRTGGRYSGFSETAPWLPISREYPENGAKTQERDKNSILEFYRSVVRSRQ